MTRSNAPHQRKSEIDSSVEARFHDSDAKRLKLAELQVGFAFFAFILIGANDGALGVLIPSIHLHYGVDKATIGLLFLLQTVGYLLAAINSGLLIEKLGNRRFLVLGAASFLLGVAALSLMPNFMVILIMMLPLGFGVAIIDAGLNTYIASMPRNAALLNYLHAFYGIGALLGPVIASTILAIRWGWNSVYILWIGMSLVLLIGFQLVFKDQHISPREDAATRPKSNVLVAALREPVVWIAALFMLIYVGAEVSVGSWTYSFLTEERRVPILLAGWMVSGYWIGLTLGRLTLARVTLWIGSERLIQGCLVGVVIAVLFVWLLPVYAVSAVGLGLMGFSFGPIYPTTIALISNKVSSRILPSVIGFIVSLGSIGAAICPWLAGMLAERIGLWSLMPYVIILTAAMVLLWKVLQVRPQV
ncbi:MAG: MFS transporter [Chloroflexi bacterium]|nr:MAG: MFS transporter [Chloroflexota bacterium]